MRTQVLVLATVGLLMAGCSSPGTSTTPGMSAANPSAGSVLAPENRGGGNKQADLAGINAVNALGSPVKSYDDGGSATNNSKQVDGPDIRHTGNGACNDGIETFVPDRHGDPNSTETLYFYNASCTSLARDVVRVWTTGSTAGSETVNKTTTNYAPGNPNVPTSTRTTINNYTNGTFNKNGYPDYSDGFTLEGTSTLVISGTKSVNSDQEELMQPSKSNVNNYCTDTAGYNAVGVKGLDESFGWQGGAYNGGIRTENGNGSVTWSATHTGETEFGMAGTLGIAVGTYNTACPITTPAYTLTGGMDKGSYSLPIQVTYQHGQVTALTVTDGTLANGDSLNVTTNASQSTSGQPYIDGTVTKGSTTLATFDLNGWGNGTLSITSNGNQFQVVDWNVVR
jgi:uncharacterized protein YceK